MSPDEIRQQFIAYFERHGHIHLPGLPLVSNDPSVTTLFAIAGMQQMIPYFMGREQPPGPNMVTVQKAVRTVDIDEVGDDTHLTYLEMLGNFSVGDYFKREAIHYTWDFLVNSLGIPAERWWAVTYPGDDEAHQAWLEVGVPEDRIGETEENWWGPPGASGPCGPNSEIHYDYGPEYGCGEPDCRPERECCGRFVEIWNDVFMSFYQDESGARRPLPWNNIDTGMGFERLVTVASGVRSPYETELFQPVIKTLTELSGVPYGAGDRSDRSIRIIADHCRAAVMITADGVMPSTQRRGYVLRRLIRRAAMHGRLLGIEKPFLVRPVETVIDNLSGYHTELNGRREHVLRVIGEEEQRFQQTLARGLGIFEEIVSRVAPGESIAGEDAFLLFDTHGFPLELTEELATERQIQVDREGFQEALAAQRTRAQSSASRGSIGTDPEVYAAVAESIPASVFSGYDELKTTSSVAAILVHGESVNQVEGDVEAQVILIETPFYAESGGQVGDRGVIRGDNGMARVMNTTRPYAPLIVHHVQIAQGSIAVGDVVEAEVDAERRLHVLPHHSGTHLLHKALQEVLGPEATQAGSLVAPDRLRFDFRWPRALTEDEITEVQDRVNVAIWSNLPVRAEIMPYDEALKTGAMALFGEKYGDRVRVVTMGDWSKELCGGTHVTATGDIGLLLITREESIGSGIRRIEALAGAAAYGYVGELRGRLAETARALETSPESIVSRAQQVATQLKETAKRVDTLNKRLAVQEAETLLHGAVSIDGLTVVARRIMADNVDHLKAATDEVKARLDRGIVVLASVTESGPKFTMAVTRNLTDQGYNAGKILKTAAARAHGNAGGSPEFAQGGGSDASKVDEVLSTAMDIIRQTAER